MKANQLINFFPKRKSNDDQMKVNINQINSDSEFKPGMTPDEISEIVSNKIISLIKAQFKATEEKYYKTNPR